MASYFADEQLLESQQGIQYHLRLDDQPMTYADVLQHWRVSSKFRKYFNEVLANAPFPAFRWETPCLTSSSTDRVFEFVLLAAPSFVKRRTDTETFASYYASDDQDAGIVQFPSLGKDALLIVPSPRTDDDVYGHLADFVRRAPDEQRDALWQVVAQAMYEQLEQRPVWLNTEGGGVAWLHVRLDSVPKYYGYAPYRQRD